MLKSRGGQAQFLAASLCLSYVNSQMLRAVVILSIQV